MIRRWPSASGNVSGFLTYPRYERIGWASSLQNMLRMLSTALDSPQRSRGFWTMVADGFGIDWALEKRRPMEKVLIDLRAEYGKKPTPALARTIELLAAELEDRRTRSAITTVAA